MRAGGRELLGPHSVKKKKKLTFINLLWATELLKTTLENIKGLKSNFKDVIQETSGLVKSWEMCTEKIPKRMKTFFLRTISSRNNYE